MLKAMTGKVTPILVLSFGCFIALGMVTGMLGVAWPSMRLTFNLPLDALVALLAGSTVGFFVGSIFAGQVMGRLGVNTTLMAANLLAAAGLVGYVFAPDWWVLVAFSLLTGWASGTIDSGLNIYMAANHGVTIMNWMHACFGVGATIGPLVMTAVLTANLSWQVGYAIAAVVYFLLGMAFLLANGQFKIKSHDFSTTRQSEKVQRVRPLDTLKLPVVLLSILLFLLYTGVESSTGQWTYTLFTESRAITPYTAGIITSVFWGMLTIGRFVLGPLASKVGIQRLLRVSMIGAVIASILYLFQNLTIGFLAVALMGFSLSAIFPTLTSDTPARTGMLHAPNTIGFQTGSASIGFAVLPGLAGILAEKAGLETLGPFLIVSSVLMLLTNEAVLRLLQRNLSLGQTNLAESPID